MVVRHSDQCVAREIDLLFAKEHLAEFCERNGVPFTRFDRFSDLVFRLGFERT